MERFDNERLALAGEKGREEGNGGRMVEWSVCKRDGLVGLVLDREREGASSMCTVINIYISATLLIYVLFTILFADSACCRHRYPWLV